MKNRHRELLSSSHDFLVNEIPVEQTLEALRPRNILTRHDFDQLRTLRHQGRKALARYLLAILPNRGTDAFEAFLESLQEANAQHLVDLLLQQAGVQTVDDLLKFTENDDTAQRPLSTPTDTPLPQGPDPHEYVVRLTKNGKLIRRFVDPAKISPVLAQNKIITAREADTVLHLHGRNKKWDLIFAVLLQRGERAYQAFMAALLKNDYSTVFHTINETSTGKLGSEDEYISDDDDDDDRHYNDDLNSDEEIKQEVNQLKQEEEKRERMMEDDTFSSKADDEMLKMSSDLADVNIADGYNRSATTDLQKDRILSPSENENEAKQESGNDELDKKEPTNPSTDANEYDSETRLSGSITIDNASETISYKTPTPVRTKPSV